MKEAPAHLSHRPSAEFTYTNYRGETTERSIIPVDITFRDTEHHPEPQYIIRAWDMGKGAYRDFAMKDFGVRTPTAPQETAGEAVTDEMVERACRCHNVGWSKWHEPQKKTAREVMRHTLKIVLADYPTPTAAPTDNAALVEAWPRWRAMLLDESPIPGAAIKEMDAALASRPAEATSRDYSDLGMTTEQGAAFEAMCQSHDEATRRERVEAKPALHPYADWELFGKFICHATERNLDEIDAFIRSWNEGDWFALDKEWPEWVEFVRLEGEKTCG